MHPFDWTVLANMNSDAADSKLDAIVAEYLRHCGRPVDMDKLLHALAPHGYSSFELKESVWRLLDQHEAELTDAREIMIVSA